MKRIVIESDQFGRPNGFVHVQFETKEDAESAMSKDKDYIGKIATPSLSFNSF